MRLLARKAGTLVEDNRAENSFAHLEGAEWLWLDVDVDELMSAALEPVLEKLQVHPLALSDARRERHPPKFEKFSDNTLLILREDYSALDEVEFDYAPLSVFWSDTLVITVRHRQSLAVDALYAEVQGSADRRFAVPLDLVARLARLSCDRFTERLLAVEQRLDQREEGIVESRSDDFLHELLMESSVLKRMARSLRYQRNAIENTLAEYRHSSRHSAHQLQDVLENADRAATMAQMLADISVDLMNAFLSLHAHRLNRIMQVLTVLTAVFLPLTLVAGIYGMNFDHMPELHWRWAYPLVIAFMLCCAGGMIFLFKRLRWL